MAPGQQSINQRVSNHPFYQNNVRKDKAWHLIAVVLGVEGEYIRFRIIAWSRDLAWIRLARKAALRCRNSPSGNASRAESQTFRAAADAAETRAEESWRLSGRFCFVLVLDCYFRLWFLDFMYKISQLILIKNMFSLLSYRVISFTLILIFSSSSLCTLLFPFK